MVFTVIEMQYVLVFYATKVALLTVEWAAMVLLDQWSSIALTIAQLKIGQVGVEVITTPLTVE